MDKSDDNWPILYSNLVSLRKFWGHLRKILGREGADVNTSGMFY